MMADEYIRRAEALEITTRTCGDYAAAFAEIRKLPAADVAPVVHGQWGDNGWGEQLLLLPKLRRTDGRRRRERMSDTLARLLAALWQIIRVVAVAGILVCEMAVISWLFLAAIDGREAVEEKIEQLKERKKK